MPDGLCECGCGERTRIAPKSGRSRDWVRGEPLRFIAGHQLRRTPHAFIVDAGGCWIWQRHVESNGYGKCWDPRTRRPGAWAHVVEWEKAHGPVPAGLELDHLCRVPACVNPEHMELVTSGENTRRGASAKLTWPVVRQVRAVVEPHTVTAERLGVHPSVICRVRSRKSWWPDPFMADDAGVWAARLEC
jgi:hypothetical protein